MPKTLMRLLPAAICLLPNLLFAAAQSASPPAATNSQSEDTYIVQAGDTLVGIARRLGLTSQPLAKAKAPEQTDNVVAGNMLRLPVTPLETNQTAPAPATAATERPAPAATPPAAAQSAAPLQPKPPAPAQPMSQAPLPKLVQPPVKADAATGTKTGTNVAKPGIVPPHAAAEPAQAPVKSADATGDAARLAVGAYVNPTLGVLRVTQTPTGIAVSRDNRTIAMRHLLYGVFDGADATGDIQGLRLQYDDDGQVRALLYSSSSGRDIPFTRMMK
ncbi:LysM peptidoglycan-binding domain-containing protein [Solidesulfovibrio carbinolicus]|uniref:Metalloendopeptidase n=1 Tax=Solidesulfovibrio carbinolicus TaxID=296842 RepID=A0A4P6HNW1_9BACT|nr:LysM domain-containing protein [Solidesulfovibrio carbinolicus]QAZ68354.1 metalloendopeptidase [Solidesulfovibrio carbinolicus]